VFPRKLLGIAALNMLGTIAAAEPEGSDVRHEVEKLHREQHAATMAVRRWERRHDTSTLGKARRARARI
jgi:hypothetical protein